MATLAVLFVVTTVFVLGVPAPCPRFCSCYLDSNAFCYNTPLETIVNGFNNDLEFFTLSGGHQPVIKNNTFASTSLGNVRVMSLLTSDIAVIEPSAFRGLEELSQLDMTSNLLGDIHPDTFPADLYALTLSANPLDIPEHAPFLNIAMLGRLYIENSNLTVIPEQMFINMKLLTFLDLKHNLIHTASSKAFRSLRKLQQVDLSYNKLKSLSFDLFEYNWELTFVNLDGNLLNIPGDNTLFTAPSLKVLHISFNNIRVIGNNTFKHFRNLKSLHITNNMITHLKNTSFNEMHNLKYVDFSQNKIKYILPHTFDNNMKLKTMILSGNPLDLHTVVPFISAPKLEKLVLNSCNISTIPQESFQNMLLLNDIDLSNNLIEDMDNSLFEKHQRLSTVTISGNPLACRCRKRELRNWARSVRIRIVSTCILGGRRRRVNCNLSRYQARLTKPLVYT